MTSLPNGSTKMISQGHKITPQIIEKKIRVLSLSPSGNVKVVQSISVELHKLIEEVTAYINRPDIEKELALELQKQRTTLLFEELKCAQFFDAHQILLSSLSHPSPQAELEALQEMKKKIHSKSTAITRVFKQFSSASSKSGLDQPASQILDGEVSPRLSSAPPSAALLLSEKPLSATMSQSKISEPSTLYTQLFSSISSGSSSLSADSVDGFLASSLLYQNAHRLLLRSETIMRHVGKKISATRDASTHLNEFSTMFTDLLQDAVNLIFVLRSLVSADQLPKPKITASCFLCRHQGDSYDPNCTIKLGKMTERITLKKIGNKLLDMRRHDLQNSLNDSGLAKRIEYQSSISALEAKKQRVEELKLQLRAIRQRNEEERTQLQEARALLGKVAEYNVEIQTSIDALKVEAQEEYTKYKKMKVERQRRQIDLASLRRHLLSHLLTIMPLATHSSRQGHSMFMNLAIPDSGEYGYPGKLDKQELMASGLGYVTRMLLIMAKYLGVGLLYEMRFRGSESVIWRDGSSHKYILSEAHPSKDETSWRQACYRLNANMYYMCYSQGLVFRHGQPGKFGLGNLLTLVSSKYAHQVGFDVPPNFTVVDADQAASMPKVLTTAASTSLAQSMSPTASTMIPPGYPSPDTSRISKPPTGPSPISGTPLATSLSHSNVMVDSMSVDGMVATEVKVSLPLDKDLEDFFQVDYIAPMPDNPEQILHYEKAHLDHSVRSSPTLSRSASSDKPRSEGTASDDDPDDKLLIIDNGDRGLQV